MHGWLKENPQGRFGAHDYSLEQWGFTRQGSHPISRIILGFTQKKSK